MGLRPHPRDCPCVDCVEERFLARTPAEERERGVDHDNILASEWDELKKAIATIKMLVRKKGKHAM